MPPIGRGLVTLDELRLTMFRLEGRLARIEDFLEALVAARAAAPAPAAPPPAFRPEPVGAAAELQAGAELPASPAEVGAAFEGAGTRWREMLKGLPPAPAAAAPRAPTGPGSRAWRGEYRRSVYAPYYALGRTAAAAGIGIEACPLAGDRGIAGARRLAWQEGWRSVMSAP